MPTEIESSHEIATKIPSEFDDIKNQKYFSETYKNVVSRYGNDFDDTEIGLIKGVRKKSYQEYKGEITKLRSTIIGNRIDKGIFEYKNPEFINLDKNIIRKINDANKQRKFREVALNLKKQFNNLSTDELKIIETEFLYSKNTNITPNFDKIFNKIQNGRASKEISIIEKGKSKELDLELDKKRNDLSNLQASITASQTTPSPILKEKTTGEINNINNLQKLWPSENEVKEMNNLKINPYFEKLKNKLFNGNYDWNENSHGKYVNCIFNEYANEIGFFFELNDSDDKLDDKILNITLKHLKLIAQGQEFNSKSLIDEVYHTIIHHDEKYMEISVKKLVNYVNSNDFLDSLRDENDNIPIENNDENTKSQKKYLEKIGISWEDYQKTVIIQKKLNKINDKLEKGEQLTDGEKNFLKNFQNGNNDSDILINKKLQKIISRFNMAYGKNGEIITEFIKLYEIRHFQEKDEIKRPNGHIHNINNPNKIEGDMNSINPDAIVIYNNDIHNYIFNGNPNEYYTDFDENISIEYRKSLYQKLIKQHEGDKIFQESIKYLDEIGNINKKKVEEEHIDKKSIIKNHKTINKMINDLAKKEFHDKEKIKKINDICTKKCIMSTCFRALSAYFDTTNNNGENFANEFEINDINENIGFDEETGIIKMTGKIKGNNHIGLYYDTKNGELSFDNFIGFDSNVGYILGKNNGIIENKIKIQVPTMDEMERQTKKVNKELIYNLSINTPQYIHTLSKCIKESLRLGCFQGFIGTTMDVNKQMVQEFNEKNILKQDIIKSIYTKYYDQDSASKIMNDKLVIDANSPEQYKLVELISKSIDACQNENQLLRFRNLVNKFDNILENNPKLVKKDRLLSILFGDNKDIENDIYDNSKNIIKNENPELSITQKENNINYSEYERYENESNSLNYFIFLDLLSDNGTINLDAFNTALATIEKEGEQLLDKKEGILWTNYLLKVAQGDLPNITNIGVKNKRPSNKKQYNDNDSEPS